MSDERVERKIDGPLSAKTRWMNQKMRRDSHKRSATIAILNARRMRIRARGHARPYRRAHDAKGPLIFLPAP